MTWAINDKAPLGALSLFAEFENEFVLFVENTEDSDQVCARMEVFFDDARIRSAFDQSLGCHRIVG